MKKTSRYESGRIAAGLITVLVLIVLIGGVVWIYSSSRAASARDTFRLAKDSSRDAATTTKVKTALLLSKHVSAFDTAVGTARGEVTLTGEVPTEEIKRLAAAIAQDTSGVTAVRNNLTVNPGVAGNPEVSLGTQRHFLSILDVGHTPWACPSAVTVVGEVHGTTSGTGIGGDSGAECPHASPAWASARCVSNSVVPT
jgi:hypothetical protein